jgi:hypothetical protein
MLKDKIGKFLDYVKLEFDASKFDDECWLEAIIEWNDIREKTFGRDNSVLDENDITEIKKRWGRGWW